MTLLKIKHKMYKDYLTFKSFCPYRRHGQVYCDHKLNLNLVKANAHGTFPLKKCRANFCPYFVDSQAELKKRLLKVGVYI